MLNNPQRPVQIVFVGKAHPADDAGKALIQQVYQLSRSDAYRGKVVFLENYDVEMARYLVSGTDLWLNTPKHALPMHYSKRELDGSFCYKIHMQPSETGSMGYGV